MQEFEMNQEVTAAYPAGMPRIQNESSSSNEIEVALESSPLITTGNAGAGNANVISTNMSSQQNVDIIGILNSPDASVTPSRSLVPVLPLAGTPQRHVNQHSQQPLTPDNKRSELLESQKQISYNSIAKIDFPAIEVTVDSGSSDSHNSSYTPLSPLTPSYVSSDAKKMSSALNNSADNLINVLEKITSKQSKQRHKNMDVDDNDRYTDMGTDRTIYDPSGTPRKQSDTAGSGNMNPFHLNLDSSSSSSDEEDDNVDSINTPITRNERYDQRKSQQKERYHRNGNNGNGNNKRKIFSDLKPQQQLNRNISAGSYGTVNSYQQQQRYSEYPQPSFKKAKSTRKGEDPTLHAQSFVLALAFFALWSPQNLMAPNLTQMAEYFHFSPEERDLYLGANIAFATGVLSLPVSALLGFLADVVPSRKRLYAFTVLAGALASICTGLSETYAQLYFARFVCGGCMAGAVPIAFSLLGDLFDAKDRNAASSGLTAMMGAGILFGQVFAGMVGDIVGWKRPFFISGVLTIVTSFMVMIFVREPVRGGKEKVLQEMIAKGTKYDRKLTLEGFLHAMTQNKTNIILMLQGFFTSLPWGILFTFMNDYLSQEQGLSVPASTFLVLWFGLGMAAGGIVGGYIGSICMRINRSSLPIFMAVCTFVGIFPFLGLLDLKFRGASLLAVTLAFTGGFIASLPSVNVRPCLLNVNPPETRGAAMTAANLIINVARGAGPSLITLPQSFFGVSRQYSFNMTIIVFWTITTLMLVALSKTLPFDQDTMDAELARYAEQMVKANELDEENGGTDATATSLRVEDLREMRESTTRMEIYDDFTAAGNESIVSIEDRVGMTSFDAAAAQESWSFIEGALREIAELSHIRPRYHALNDIENNDVVWDTSYEEDQQEEEEYVRSKGRDHSIPGVGSSAEL